MREYVPSKFSRVGVSVSPLSFLSKEGSAFSIQALDHSIVRVQHVPPPGDYHGHIPQETTHCVAPDDPRHRFFSNPPRSPTEEAKGAISNETVAVHVSGTPRDAVAARFPCPPPDVISNPDGGMTVVTDSLQIVVKLDPEDGDISLNWSSVAVPEFPLLQDLPHRSYSLFKNSLGARHFVVNKETDVCYGMGERASPLFLNKRRFRLETMDALGYDATATDPLYKNIPFYIALDTVTRQAFGVYYDSLASGISDFGLEIDAFWGFYRHHTVKSGFGLDMYFIFGPSIEKVVEGFTRIVGHPILPPKYALGYLASAMGYAETEEAQVMISRFPDLCRKWNIPCDLLHLSSGYTVDPENGARNVFTWNSLRSSGIRIAANIKPWLLSRHPEYPNMFLKRGFVWSPEEDNASTTRLWSAGGGANATGSYIDFSSKPGREFWKKGVTDLLDLGIEGIWNDNNEIALPDDNHIYAHSNKGATPSTAGSAGRSLQTLMMATASFEALVERFPKRRPFLITRSGCAGIQRYAAQTWSGDNFSSWETLKHNIPMGLNAGLSGLAGYGHDVGGFVGPRPEAELFVRWVQNGVFHPRFCIHSWKDEGVTEPWMYPEVLPIIREAIHLRYKILPYIYTLSHEAARTGHPVIRPLVYHFQLDPKIQTSSFEFMLGRSLLIASVFEAKATTRRVLLPSGDPWCDLWTGEWHAGGMEVDLQVPLERCGGVLAYAGAIIPTGPVIKYVGEPGADNERVVWCFPYPFDAKSPAKAVRKSETFLIEDDGESMDAPTTEIKLSMEAGVAEVSVGVTTVKKDFKITYNTIWFVLPHGDKRTLRGVGENVVSRVGDDGRAQFFGASPPVTMGDAVVPDIADERDAAPGFPAVDRETRFSKYDASDPRLQIINDEKNFSPIVLEYMKKHWKMADRGFDYNVVAVFGSQSTGKSTLLNRLFGTNFDVMNEASGRQQTTKGIWASKANDANLMVLDVEGTDGGERFEDQDFERKSALFSLAISEVVIVNMYENSVGLYNGANLGLLKTVMDVNLQLFQQTGSPKTCLHFVIRDFTEQTPLSKLAATIQGYLVKIWSGLSKPPGKEDSKIEDFFDFAFAGLPHKIFARESFESGVAKLRSKFIDKTNPEFVFKPNYHKHIPADGFPHFAKSIWAKILSNRDLDLPTQTQLLAQHRCEEIAKEVFEGFSGSVAKFKAPLESGVVLESLGADVNAIVEECLAKFDKEASRYHSSVYKEKRNEFFEKMATALHVYYVQQLGNLHKKAIESFKSTLAKSLSSEEGGFSAKLSLASSEAESFYKKGAEASKLKGADWDNSKYESLFLAEMAKIGKEKRSEAVDKMVKGLEKSAGLSLADCVQLAMNEGSPQLWKNVLMSFKGIVDITDAQLRKKAQGFDSSDEELQILSKALQWQGWASLLEAIHKEMATDVLLGRLRGRFEAKFRYDDKGVPRIWKLDDPIDTYFKSATDEVDKLLSMLTKIDAPLQMIPDEIIEDERFVPSSLTVLSAPQLQSVKERFKKDADSLFIEAKRSMVITTAKIPFWFVALTILLGWNEFMTVLRSPIYFITLLLFGAGAYAIWYLGMIAPMYSVVKATSREMANQTRTMLEDRGLAVENILNGRVLQEPASILRSNSTAPAASRLSHKKSATFSNGKEGESFEMKPTRSSTMPLRKGSGEEGSVAGRKGFVAEDD
ncbi:Dynamin-like GTPase that mediates homotypic ER fusion [Dinochytrium kinnereticum]|nr:Dynamin-like GTPase that mediates homotypic ER fusion [Dinochytrium kinnereticum]